MILKGAQVLPHALINHVETKLGKNGEKLLEYVKWLHDRIIALRKDESYQPVLHIDVYNRKSTRLNSSQTCALPIVVKECKIGRASCRERV